MKTKQAQTNLFNGGLNYDTNPLMTPENIMTDCVNGTLLTYNGNELVLQNDSGNVPVNGAVLPEGYVPLVSAENNGVLYIVSHNPIDKSTQIGTYPSPLSYAHAITFTDTSNQEDVLNLNDTIVNVSKHSWPVKFYSESEDLMLNPGDKYKIILSETLHPTIEIGFYAFVDNVLRPIDLVYYTNNQSAGYVTYLKPYAAQLAYQYRFKQIEAYDVTANDTSKQSTLNLTWSLLSKDYAELENPNVTYYNRVSLRLTNDTESINYFDVLDANNRRKYSWEKFNRPTQNTFTVKNSFIDTYTNTEDISSCLPSLNLLKLADDNDNIKWDSKDGVLEIDGVVYNKLVIESTPVVVIQNEGVQQQIVYDTLTNTYTTLLQNVVVESHIISYKYKVLVKGEDGFKLADKSDIWAHKDTYTNVYIEFDYDTLSGQLQSDQINYISIKVSEITEGGLNDLTTLRLTQADKSFQFDDINPDKNIYFIESNGDNNILKISLWLTNDIVLSEMPYTLQFNFGKNKIQTPIMFFKSIYTYTPSWAEEPHLSPVSKNINGFYEVVSKLSGTKVKIETQSVMPLPYSLKSYLYPDMLESASVLTPAQDYIVFDRELLPGIHEFYDSRGTLAETVVVNTKYSVSETAQYLIESITPSFYTFKYIKNQTIDSNIDPLIVGDGSGSTTPEITLDGYYTGTIFTKNSSDTVIRLKVADGSNGYFILNEAWGRLARLGNNVIARVETINGVGELTLTKDLINKNLFITFATSISATSSPPIITFDYKNISQETTRIQNTSISTTVSMLNSFLMNDVDSSVLSYNDLSFNEWFGLNKIIDGDLYDVLNGYKLQSQSDIITLSTNSARNRSYNYEDNKVNYKYDFVFTEKDVVNGQLNNDSKPQLIWTKNHNFVIQPLTNTIQSLFPDIGIWKNIQVNYSNKKPTNTNLDNLNGSFDGDETKTIDTNVQHTVKKILKMDFKIDPTPVLWNYDRKYLCENTSWTEDDKDKYYTKNKLAYTYHKPVKWECVDVTGGWEYAEGLIEFKINNTLFLNWIQTNGVVVSNKYRLEPLFDTAQQFLSKVQHRWLNYAPYWKGYNDNNHSTSYTYLKEMFFKGQQLNDCEVLIGQSSNDYPIFPQECGDKNQKHVTLIFPAYSSIFTNTKLLIPGALGFSNVGTDAEEKVIKLKSFLSRHLYAKVEKAEKSNVFYLSDKQDLDVTEEDVGALNITVNLQWTLYPSINNNSLIGLNYCNSFTNNFNANVDELNSISTTTDITIGKIPSTEIENYSELERGIKGTFSELKKIAPKKSDYHYEVGEWNKVFWTEGVIINDGDSLLELDPAEVGFLETIANKLYYRQNRFYLNIKNPYEMNPNEMRAKCFAAGRDLYDGEERPCWPIAPIEIIDWGRYSSVIDQLIGEKFDYVDIRY